MAKKPLPTPEQLRQLLDYDPDTGALTWRVRTPDMFAPNSRSADHRCSNWNSRFAGKSAFQSVRTNGYLYGTVLDRCFQAHRVIWAMTKGKWPLHDIDHINHDRADNRIVNLREVTRSDNLRNISLRSNNSSGVNGVYWNKARSKWQAYIRHGGKARHLGLFKTLDEAKAARLSANRKFGYHENHGS